MKSPRITNESRPPLWAALGAPLIGVPLMVGLLALGAHKTDVPPTNTVPAMTAEPVDTHVVEPVSGDTAERLQEDLSAG